MKFTKTEIDRIPPGDPGGTWHPDDDTPGLYVVAYPSGARVFAVRVRNVAGRRRVLRLGRYGRVTPDAARRKARELLAEAALGGDPAADRDEARRKPTWGDWTDRYLERVAFTKKHARVDSRFLGRTKGTRYATIARRWKDRPVDEVTREDIENARTEIAKSGHAPAANRWTASIRACLSAAVKSGLIPYNPAARLTPFLENAPRARVFSDDEMTAFLRAVAAEKDVLGAAALRWLAESGARLSEVLRAKWTDLDLEAEPATWRIPSPKSGRPQIVPLAPSTVALLKRLPKMGPLVIPGRKDEPRPDLRKTWERVLRAAGLEKSGLHVHDLRRSFGLAVARSAGLHVASRLLRHSDIRVTEACYAPLGMAELAAAMERRAHVLPFAAKPKAKAS